MKHSLPVVATVLLVLGTGLLSVPAQAGSRPQRVRSAVGVVKLWSESQHLYVKGDIGVADARLRELETWLAANAPHWTVVLLESAEGERFTDAEGTSFEGIEAVKHALGKGLSNRTHFGALRHPRTGEQDGAIFLLSLEERNLSYFGSDAQDRRELGEEHWVGQLDAAAIAAMRNGGRVVDAARDTITTIDARLALVVSQEEAAREQRRVSLRDRLQGLLGALDTIAALRDETFQARAVPLVPQANPDLAGLRAKVTLALTLLEPADKARFEPAEAAHEALRVAIDEARQGVEDCRAALTRLRQEETALASRLAHPLRRFEPPEVGAAQEALEMARSAAQVLASDREARFAEAVARREALDKVLEELSRSEQRMNALPGLLDAAGQRRDAALVQSHLAASREALRKAREAFERGEPAFTGRVRASDEAYAVALAGIRKAEAERALRVFGVFVGSVTLLTVLGIARFRRNRRRREALTRYTQWRTAIDEKTQALFGLLERTHAVAGRSREDIEQRYAGVSRERGLKLASDVDELFLLSVAAARVLGEADTWLTGGTGVLNWFGKHLTTGRYARVTRLLRDQPITFHPDEGVEWVLRGGRTDTQKLIGPLASHQPFSLSFEALVEAFNSRAANALAVLDSLEHAPERAREASTLLEGLAAELRGHEAEVEGLRAPALVGRVAPALEACVGHARALLLQDPLGALEGPLQEGLRQGLDTRALRAVLGRGRSEVLPTAERAGVALVATGLSRHWVDQSIELLTHAGNAVAEALVERPATADLQSLTEGLERLRTRASEAEALVATAGKARDELTRAARAIDTARTELGQAMGKPPSALLREEGSNPSDLANAGERSLAEAREALGKGALEPALTGLIAALARVAEVDAVLAHSREALARFSPRREACRTEARRLERLAAEREALLGDLTRRYQPSALRLRAGDPVHPNANGTVGDNLDEAASHRKQAAGVLREADAAFDAARLLATAELLRQVEGHHALVAHRLDELEEKVRQLEAAEAANARVLTATELWVTACATEVADPRTMAPTQAALAEAGLLLQAAREAVVARPSEPFTATERLTAATLALTHVQQCVASDRALHARAGERIASARAELKQAESLAKRAASDGVSDSQETVRARRAVEDLGRALAMAARALDDAHGDWNTVDAEAGRIESRSETEAATLRGELKAAERAVDAIQEATRAVQRADRWSGGYGVRIAGRPGTPQLSDARAALQQGLYPAAEQAARRAERAALDAIHEAEREEDRLRREEEERHEAERRRQEAERQEREEEERHRREAAQPRSTSSSWSSRGDDDGSPSGSGSGFRSSSW
ncbi:hypothetical protein [Pyxidicoccus trucidator]|uniref:hypothetical protein n=1 Tax=Pyxidicoccus trucidator TaxID=2709662 RepID=UPI0013DB0656|nr:hypothetical protein [Pyxidicoccus trucidator]